MFKPRFKESALLAALVLANACTTDFTGYHLESAAADAGAPDVEAGSGGLAEGGRASGMAGSGAGGREGGGAGGSEVADAGSGAGTVTMTDGGSAGEPATVGGASGGGGTPIVLLTGTPPSCVGLANTCGPSGTSSCCTASLVPGGTYNRSNQAVAPATVSDFGLDEYEVSVGRFRSFVQVYAQAMTAAGAGKNPNGGVDSGWTTDWNVRLPANAAMLVSGITAATCGSTFTYTADPGSHENLPITCLTWYEAFAFCAWDGGRLPTEAEWNYAAAGGSEERTYPWGSATPDTTRAVFQPAALQTVGAKGEAGSAKWGQVDMAGNAWEWNLDVFATPYVQTTCQDCANTTLVATSTRVFRGGSAGNPAGFLLAATRNSYDPSKSSGYVGVRCARAP